MVNNWELALNTYKYPVTLGSYRNAQKYKGYFLFQPIENAHTTMLFEDHFRSGAGEHIELWLEVVYWKMHSQGGRRDNKTNDVGTHFEEAQIKANQLLTACNRYIADDTSENLEAIIRLLDSVVIR